MVRKRIKEEGMGEREDGGCIQEKEIDLYTELRERSNAPYHKKNNLTECDPKLNVGFKSHVRYFTADALQSGQISYYHINIIW